MSREQDIRNRLRINRENEDAGLRECLSTPNGRKFIWWVYKQCGMRENVAMQADNGEMAPLMTARQIGKQVPGQALENRAKLVDHRNWLIMLAENDEALDDGRADDRGGENDEAGGE